MRVIITRLVAACVVITSACLVAYGALQAHRGLGPVAATASPTPAVSPATPPRVRPASPFRDVGTETAAKPAPAETTPATQVAQTASPPAAAAASASAPAPTPSPTQAAASNLPAPGAATATPAAVTPHPSASTAAPAPTAAPSAPPPPVAAASCPGNPNALGVSRVVEIDTTGGPGFGFEHFKAYDFLKPGEVVLTFDDGPWPHNTEAVLSALAAQCVKATFFPIGKHAMWSPQILKEVAAAGHTIGSHTWSHADLSKKTPEEAKEEIEKGFSAVHVALGEDTPFAPFFRFPALRHPPEMLTYLGERNIAIFSTDMDSFDFKLRKPEQVIQSVMAKLKKNGKGIILMHDFQRHTAEAMPELLNQLKANGYRIVHVKPKEPVKTLAQYDAEMAKEIQGGGTAARPVSSVVRTITGD